MSTIYESGTKYFQANSTEGGATASGANSIAVGPRALASGEGSIAQGYNATASQLNSVAIGSNANALAPNSVALGANSVADQANTISVGALGNERRITNVAPGIADTDAVNVGQLKQTQANIDELEKAMGKGLAMSNAMSMLGGSPDGKPYQVSVALGTYSKYGAMAVGLSMVKRVKGVPVLFRMGLATDGSKMSSGASASLSFGSD